MAVNCNTILYTHRFRSSFLYIRCDEHSKQQRVVDDGSFEHTRLVRSGGGSQRGPWKKITAAAAAAYPNCRSGWWLRQLLRLAQQSPLAFSPIDHLGSCCYCSSRSYRHRRFGPCNCDGLSQGLFSFSHGTPHTTISWLPANTNIILSTLHFIHKRL